MEINQYTKQTNKQSVSPIANRQQTPNNLQTEDVTNVMRRAKDFPGALSPSDISLLQSAIGNQAVGRVLQQNVFASNSSFAKRQGTPIQPKLTIGQPNAQYEQEADQVAVQEMTIPSFATQQPVQREVRAEGAKEVQTKPLATPSLNSYESNVSLLPDDMCTFMESRFGHDFSEVGVHTNQRVGEYAPRTTVAVHASTFAPYTVQREPSDADGDKTEPTQTPGTSGSQLTQALAGAASQLDVEFNAFIPGSLGSSFASFPYPTDLKNQKAFEADLKAVKGTWLKEPGSFADNDTGPWYFATDNRSFGGGNHRLGFTGTIAQSQIGALGGKPKLFQHNTSGSEHVRWKHTGYFTSKDETGSVEGPDFKSAATKSNENHADTSVNESTVTTDASANYPFKTGSPDIDYTVIFKLKREADGKIRLRFEITKNLFPFYELLINKKSIWTYSASDPGPTIKNLTTTDTFKSGDWFF